MQKYNEPTIGIIDSGIGGVAVLNKILAKYKSGNYIYLADNLYMPYGNKTKHWLKKRILNLIKLLKERYCVERVIVACNTASTVINDLDNSIVTFKFNEKETYLTTCLTKKNLPGINIVADKTLAKHIEKNIGEEKTLNKVIKRIVKKHDLSTLKRFVLGCTHFELVDYLFKKYCPNGEIINNSSNMINDLKMENVSKEINVVVLLTKKDIALEKRIYKLIIKPTISSC